MVQKKNILIIEPDHRLRTLVRTQLELAGHFIISISSASSALLLLNDITPPSLILLSPSVADLTVDQFVLELKKNQAHKNVPISQLGLSANGTKIPGAFCIADPNNLESIINLLSDRTPFSG